MDFFFVVGCAIVLAASAIFVSYPLFTTRPPVGSGELAPVSTLALMDRRDRLYTNIKELEVDHHTGKVDEIDYRALRRELEGEAIYVLRKLDHTQSQDGDLKERIEIAVRSRRQASAGVCVACGTAYHSQDHYCPQCGLALTAGN